MATTVKMDKETKSHLERLQAEVLMSVGQKVTQKEILEHLVDQAESSKTDFLDSFRELRVPVGDDEKAAFHDGVIASGHTTIDGDIDEIVCE